MILRRFVVMHRLNLSIAAFLSVASAAITIGILQSIHVLAVHDSVGSVDRVVASGGLLLFGLLLVSMSSQFVSAKLGSQLIASFRRDLSRALIDLDYQRFASRKNLVFGSFSEDIHRIAPLVAMVPSVAYNLFIVLVCSIYLANLSFPLFVVLGVGFFIPLTVYWALGEVVKAKFDLMRQSEEGMFDQLCAINEGKKELSLNKRRAKHFTQELLLPAIEKCEKAMASSHLYIGMLSAWSSFVVYIVLFAVVYFGHFVLKLPVNTVVPFVVGGLYLTGPITFLVQTNQHIAPGWASLRHLERLGVELKADPVPTDVLARGGSLAFDGWDRIRADGLLYTFPSEAEGSNKVGPFSLEIRRGEVIFIAGGNGAGKSTLLLMLCGLVAPSSGKILVNGIDVSENILAYRELFSGVFSDFFLFKDIIGCNGEYLSDERLGPLMRKMRLDGEIRPNLGVLPRTDFSTGQRKRLALLQCLAEERDICFFDEWAAEQDPTFRNYFYVDILPELKASGKTVIVISHDDRYFHVADHLIKIENGEIVSDIRPATVSEPVAAVSQFSEHI